MREQIKKKHYRKQTSKKTEQGLSMNSSGLYCDPNVTNVWLPNLLIPVEKHSGRLTKKKKEKEKRKENFFRN